MRICTPPKHESCPRAPNGEHCWVESPEQKTVGGIDEKHQNQHCTWCNDGRCVWMTRDTK